MAVGDATFSAAMRVSLGTVSHTKTAAATVSISAWKTEDAVVSPNVSNFQVNMGFLSNPGIVWLTTTAPVRVNFGALGNASQVSLASAGMAFDKFFVWAGSLASGPNAIYLANSGTVSAVVQVMIGQTG
jgi:hypothetical protein